MRRESFDALFSNFFSRDFLSLILTRHRKNRKSNQFSIYLRIYLLVDEMTKRRSFVDDDKNLNLKLFADSDLHDSNVDIIVSFVIIIDFVVFTLLFFLSSRFSSSRSSSSSQTSNRKRSSSSSRSRSQTKHDFERRREVFFSQKNEDRSWWRRENVWTNERKHRTHFHRYHARSNVSRRRFKNINVVDQNASKHLQFNKWYLQEFSWNSRVDRINVEWREDFFSHSSVRVFAASSAFEETTSCVFTRRDEHHFQ